MHPLSGTFPNNLFKIFSNYGVETPYLPRAAVTSLMCGACIPLHLINLPRLLPKLNATQITTPPIFIVGHWRSGTTYLHQLLTQDPRFACVSLLQCLSPDCPSSDYFLRPLLKLLVPKTRRIDNVQISLDAPQEEDFHMSCLSINSYHHAYYFPKQIRSLFEKYVLFENFSDHDQVQKAKQAWIKNYLYVLRHALTHSGEDSTLLLKDPSNTARISDLLELFPDAKFIHLYRNPYHIFPSTKNLHRKFQKDYAFQSIDESVLEKHILYIYQRLMGRFFEQESKIPQGNLIHVRYEELETNPLQEVKRIYGELGISNFDGVSSNFEQHIRNQKHYQKNRYRTLTRQEIDTIYQHWNFTIDRWQYAAPEASS